MANALLTNLTAITTPATGDKIYIVDVSDTTDNAGGSSRQITLGNLLAQVDEINTDLVTLTGSQTLTNKTLTTPTITNPTVSTGTFTSPVFATSADLNGVELILDADADTSITADADDQIDIKISGADDFRFTANLLDILSGSTLIINGTLDLNGTEMIVDADADTTITADTDDRIDYKLSGSDRFRMGTSDFDVVTATGNIQVAGTDPKRTFYVPASAMYPSITTPCAALVQVESNTNDVNVKVLDFDGAGTAKEYAEFGIQSPSYWDASTVTVQVIWYASAGSGTVNWEVQGLSLRDDDALDTAYGTAVEITDTLLATGDVHISPESSAMTIAGTLVAGNWLQFKIARDPANDTNTSDARLMGVRIRFGVAQYNDA